VRRYAQTKIQTVFIRRSINVLERVVETGPLEMDAGRHWACEEAKKDLWARPPTPE